MIRFWPICSSSFVWVNLSYDRLRTKSNLTWLRSSRTIHQIRINHEEWTSSSWVYQLQMWNIKETVKESWNSDVINSYINRFQSNPCQHINGEIKKLKRVLLRRDLFKNLFLFFFWKEEFVLLVNKRVNIT